MQGTFLRSVRGEIQLSSKEVKSPTYDGECCSMMQHLLARGKLKDYAVCAMRSSQSDVTLGVQGVKRGAGASKAALKGPQKLSKKALEQAALAAALQRRQRKRDRGPGLGVAALDRNASGPDALAVMRQARLAVL